MKKLHQKKKKHFSLHLGCTSLNIKEILPVGTKLDLVFIDADHTHPSPLIDLVCVLPYLHEESLILLHDVMWYMRPNAWGESFIYSLWKEEKYQNINIETGNTETLGVIKLPNDKNKLYEYLLILAKTPFRASPWDFNNDKYYLGITEEKIDRLKEIMTCYYDKNFIEEFTGCLYKNLQLYKEEFLLRTHETRFYDYLFGKISYLEKSYHSLEQKFNIFKTLTMAGLTTAGNKKILFWGASNYLNDFMKTNNYNNPNLIGIIDSDKNKQGMDFNGYKIYSPEQISKLGANIIIPTIKNNHTKHYEQIKNYLKDNNINIELSENIFI